MIEKIQFAGARLAIIREEQVQDYLSLDSAIGDLRAVLEELANKQAVNCARVRVESQARGSAWLHTLRGGLANWEVVGGKDYTSIGFDTPAMWATLVQH